MKRAFICVGILFSCFLVLPGQDIAVVPVKEYDQVSSEYLRDSLLDIYGSGKTLPDGYELQVLIALSYYPELKNARIQFVLDPHAFIPLSSRPKFFTMLRKKDKWIYKVVISDKHGSKWNDAMFRNLPFNAQIGVLGHELAHTAYYQKRGFWSMVGIGLRYPFGTFRARFERNTDRRAIDYGLGWQLLDFAEYTHEKMKDKPGKMADYMSRFYLSPDEIIVYMQKTGLY